MFNINQVNKTSSQEHLGIILDGTLLFEGHLKSASVKAKTNKALYLLQKLQNILPRPALIILNKSFTRPYLDNGDIIYEQVLIHLFTKNLSLSNAMLS